MMRTVTFDSEARKHFRFVYEGFVIGGALQDKRDHETKRRESRIVRKLKAMSAIIKLPAGTIYRDDRGFPQTLNDEQDRMASPTEPARELLDGIQVVALEQPELDLIVKYMQDTPWKLSLMDECYDAVDYLHAAPRDDTA